ncbi:hypothetical protein EDC14_102461 [Hydrogenispora ethanolica]|uniref:Uncharacterized protein n=1 Tax=Hydrogenispora ethanolica TaxID=1082276 RepID=A0A4R1RA25_HYDET|nr:hypothetical protein EDC14_102461 [Hydrogenispora ethanolica]
MNRTKYELKIDNELAMVLGKIAEKIKEIQG